MRRMTIEERIFAKGTPRFEILESRGFCREGDVFIYRRRFYEDQFEAVVTIGSDGSVSGKVLDWNNDGEEYEAIHIEAFNGGFVGAVKEEYAEILKEIHRNCFRVETFVSTQANRIAAGILERYGERPDYPFSDMENYGVFRVKETNKWYGLIMRIPYARITKNKDDRGEVDILNLKIDEARREELFAIDGIVPAYHMSHKSWASVLLDERVDDGTIYSLLDVSRSFAAKGKKRKD